MPIQYAGGTNVSQTFTGATRQDLLSNLKTYLATAGWTNLPAATATGTGPGNVGTVTLTIASPCVVTFAGHGFLGGERIILQTTGALPTGLTVNTVYFVKFIDANTFNLATTSGGANINTSGSQSGTHTLNTESVLMQSATTAQGLAINVRLKDNRGSCIQISIESTSGLLVGGSDATHGANLLPAAARTFRLIANKFQFFVCVPGIFNTTARLFMGCGVPYVPAPNTVPSNAGWLVCDSQGDAVTTVFACWRSSLQSFSGSQASNTQMLWGSTIWEVASTGSSVANMSSLVHLVMGMSVASGLEGGANGSGQPQLYRWANGDIMTSDPLLAWGLAAFGDEPQVRCQLWDALVIMDSISGDTTTTFDSHNWVNLTHSNVGSGSVPRGSLLVVTP